MAIVSKEPARLFVTTALLQGPGVNATNQWCLMTGSPAGRRVAARGGTASPRAGSIYNRFFRPVINSNGRIAVVAGLASTPQGPISALLVDRGQGPEIALSQPGPAPGFPDPFQITGWAGGPFLNARGQILMNARVTGPGTKGNGEDCLLLVEPDLSVHRVAWSGMNATLQDGTPVVLQGISLGENIAPAPAGNDDGQASLINESGVGAFVGFWEAAGIPQSGIFLLQPAEASLEPVRTSPGTMIIRLPTMAGSTYQLQQQKQLGKEPWENSGPIIPGTGDRIEIPITMPAGSPGGFFRVARIPSP